MKKKWLNVLLAIMTVTILWSFITPKGWQASGDAEDKYEMGLWKIFGHDSSRSCGVIRAVKKVYEPGEHGSLIQKISSQRYLGKHIKMTGFMKSRSATKAGFMLRADTDEDKKPLAFDNMRDRQVKGTTDWKEYSLEIDVPNNSSKITLGAYLTGEGQIWFDDITIEIVGNATIAADYVKCDTSLPREPFNLNFEQ